MGSRGVLRRGEEREGRGVPRQIYPVCAYEDFVLCSILDISPS